MTHDEWMWIFSPGFYPPKRDPREDDPDYYKDWSGRWVKRTEWTLENYESTHDWDTYCKFVQETTWGEREKLKREYLTSKGLVQWARFPHIWASAESIAASEARYQEGIRRNNQNIARARSMRHYDDVAGRLWDGWG